MLLGVEADEQMHDSPGSLMDRILAGLITALRKSMVPPHRMLHSRCCCCVDDDPTVVPEPSDYVGTLLRDPTSSHLLETLVFRSSEPVFDVIWTLYFKGKLPRLGVHPVANFVVAKALERATENQLIDACQELEPVLPKIVSTYDGYLQRTFVFLKKPNRVCTDGGAPGHSKSSGCSSQARRRGNTGAT